MNIRWKVTKTGQVSEIFVYLRYTVSKACPVFTFLVTAQAPAAAHPPAHAQAVEGLHMPHRHLQDVCLLQLAVLRRLLEKEGKTHPISYILNCTVTCEILPQNALYS